MSEMMIVDRHEGWNTSTWDNEDESDPVHFSLACLESQSLFDARKTFVESLASVTCIALDSALLLCRLMSNCGLDPTTLARGYMCLGKCIFSPIA